MSTSTMLTYEDYIKAAQTIQNLTTKLHGSYVSLVKYQTVLAALKSASHHLTASLANNNANNDFQAMTQCIHLANIVINPTAPATNNNNYVGRD